MDPSLPLYLVGPVPEGMGESHPAPGSREREVIRVPSPGAFPDEETAPGWVVLSPDLPGPDAVALLRRLGRRPGPWSPLLLDPGAPGDPAWEGVHLLPLSPGLLLPMEELERGVDGEAGSASLLSLRLLVRELARIRHDLNNPLTAALAEVQLLLMDHPPETETGESLAAVEEQLKRIRDMVAQLAAYRVRGW